MPDLDFFADLIITGTVLGVDHTSDLATVESVLGHGLTSELDPYGMITDTGLVEFGWGRDEPAKPWAVSYFGAQAHRLDWLGGKAGAALVERYGPFRERLDFADLDAAVRARGFELEQVPSANAGCAEYWEPTSRMGLITVVDAGQQRSPGTVLKMLGPRHRSLPYSEKLDRTFADYAAHLVDLDDAALNSWVDTKEQGVEWWSRLRIAIARRAWGSKEEAQPPWRRLGFALERLAFDRHIEPEDEGAIRLALAVHEAAELDLAEGLPAMDDIVAHWLEATPATLDEATILAKQAPLEPAGIRLSRRLRNQIHEIQPCLANIESPDIAARLMSWIDLKPHLLG